MGELRPKEEWRLVENHPKDRVLSSVFHPASSHAGLLLGSQLGHVPLPGPSVKFKSR